MGNVLITYQRVLLALFLVFFLGSLYLHADSGYGIKIYTQSSVAVEHYPGEIFSVSFNITNVSDKEDQFNPVLPLPDGWQTIPLLLFPFRLVPGENTVQFFAIKIPSEAPPGTYNLKYKVQGTSHPELIGVSEVDVTILPVRKIKTEILTIPQKVFATGTYVADVQVSNLGNVETAVELILRSYYQTVISQSPENPIILKPGESKIVTLKISADDHKKEKQTGYLSIDTKILETDEPLLSTTTSIDILPKKPPKIPYYETFPISSIFVAGLRNDKYSAFIDTQGKGFVDKDKKQFVEFLVRLPIQQQTSVYTQLGGPPEKYFLHYYNPRLDFYGGDGLYNITPLTLLSRYGRGGAVTLKAPYVDISTLFVNKTNTYQLSNFGTYLQFHPAENWDIQTSLLNTTGPIAPRISNRERANTGSLFTKFKNGNAFNIMGELATSGRTHLQGHEVGKGYYVKMEATPFQGVWINASKIYANPNFVGYYQDQSQSNLAFGFPLYKGIVRSSWSYQNYKANLNNERRLLYSADNTSASAEISCSLPIRMFLTGSVNFFESADRLLNTKYILRYGSLRMSQVFSYTTIQASVDYGDYTHSFLPGKSWQNYITNIYISPNKNTKYTLYGQWGYKNLTDQIYWIQVYGGAIDWSYKKKMHVQLLYETSHQLTLFRRHFLQGRFQFLLPHDHLLEFKTNIWRQTREPTTKQFLLSYTVPWNAPIRKNPRISRGQGQVFERTKEGLKPFPNIFVSCDDHRVKTDKKGIFNFKSLTPGPHSVWVDENSSLVSEKYLPLEINFEPGGRKEQDFILTKPGKIAGQVNLYAFVAVKEPEENSPIPSKFSAASQKEYVKSSGFNKVTIKLRSDESDETIIIRPDEEGRFYFNAVRPGSWTLEILSSSLPDHHKIENNPIKIKLDPEEERYIECRILPLPRTFRLLN